MARSYQGIKRIIVPATYHHKLFPVLNYKNYAHQWPNVLLALFLVFVIPQFSASAQVIKTVIAGKEYKKSKGFQKLWGKHYRKEWITPVTVRVAMLDTLVGGLVPYEVGGSRQTKTVKLRDKNNREYVLRSIDKTFTGALPDVAKGSFIERIANDQVSIAHPYSAITISPLAEAAKIYHTNPEIYYIPKQKSLGEFNDEIGDNLYLFEQRPDENWATAPNFANSKNLISTDSVIEKLLKDNENTVDQMAFVRARLFDMIIGDWGRHEDQWRWAEVENGKGTVYEPIARDRDQAYTLFDGTLLKFILNMAAPHLQSFTSDLRKVEPFNFPARNLDRHFLNEISLQQWKETATNLQNLLTDQIIDNAMKHLPQEVYDISGPEIGQKLKSRRDHLVNYAEDYYRTLAKSVDVTGSAEREFFEVKRLNDDSTQINIYSVSNNGKKKDTPIYSRMFYKSETFEVRLYGIGGEDEYEVTGDANRGIQVRLIGGSDKDKYTDLSHVKGTGHKTEIYDNAGNEFKKTSETSLHISNDPAIHDFKYAAYKFDKKGFRPILLYNNDDRFYVGLAYIVTKNKWRKEPYGFRQYFDVKYSISQKAFSATYKSVFTKLLGKWDGVFYANYDFMRWTNFYGLGNESLKTTTDLNYNRMQTSTYVATAGIERVFQHRHKVFINGFYQGVDILRDSTRYLSKAGYLNTPASFRNTDFAGANIGYVFQKLNDSILPTKGIGFLATANYTQNLKDNKKNFGQFAGEADFYVPLVKKFSIAIHGGAATLSGKPEFYQYNRIGSSLTLRGYRRDRFYGSSAFFNQNELRWISKVHSYIYNGKIGFFGLYDIGRVWIKDEISNKMHYAYGGGIILSPYNAISGQISYAISDEDRRIHLAIMKRF